MINDIIPNIVLTIYVVLLKLGINDCNKLANINSK